MYKMLKRESLRGEPIDGHQPASNPSLFQHGTNSGFPSNPAYSYRQ